MYLRRQKGEGYGGDGHCGWNGGMVAFQGFVNIGVATFILPNTGLPLPFVSYGLTSLMSLFMGMGFVLNVRLQARRAK